MRPRVLLSILALVMAVIVLGIVGVLPRLWDSFLDNTALRTLLPVLGFAVLLVLVVAALSALYRFGPANVPAGGAGRQPVRPSRRWCGLWAPQLLAVYVNNSARTTRCTEHWPVSSSSCSGCTSAPSSSSSARW